MAESRAVERNEWLGVELRHLAALAAVHRTGSFRGAADELGYVQSAVSQQIARFELIVGTRLVDRTRGHATVSLTPAGELVLGHARAILAHLGAAQAELESLACDGAQTLRVGVFESVAARAVPQILRQLGERTPRLTLEVRDPNGACANLVELGELDVAFAYLPLPDGPFECLELLSDPCALLVAADSPLAAGPAPSLTELARLPLVSPAPWPILSRVEGLLPDAADERGTVPRSMTNTAVQALVAGGVGVAIMPLLAVDETREDTVALDLSETLPPLRLALYWHRERVSPELDMLRTVVGDTFARIAAEYDGEPRPIAA